MSTPKHKNFLEVLDQNRNWLLKYGSYFVFVIIFIIVISMIKVQVPEYEGFEIHAVEEDDATEFYIITENSTLQKGHELDLNLQNGSTGAFSIISKTKVEHLNKIVLQPIQLASADYDYLVEAKRSRGKKVLRKNSLFTSLFP